LEKLRKTINISVFIDPDEEQIFETSKLDINIIELHTGSYANSRNALIFIRKLRG